MIISIIIFRIFDMTKSFFFSKPIGDLFFYFIYFIVDEKELIKPLEYLLENYYLLYVLSAFLQTIILAFVMILGFYLGHKKREKDRKKLI